MTMSQEKSKTMHVQIYGVKEVYYGICASRELFKIAELLLKESKQRSYLRTLFSW